MTKRTPRVTRRAATKGRPIKRLRQVTEGGKPGRGTRRFVLLTGLSGAGKTQAIRALEDLGYF